MLHVALRPLPSLERQLASFPLCARSRRNGHVDAGTAAGH